MNQLPFSKSIELLKKYKLGFVNYKVIKNENEIYKLKYPIAMKIASDKIIHKSDAGGVILNIKNEEQAIESFIKLQKISKEIIAQEMVYGKEVIIGMKKDSQFGHVVMFGLGGIFVEVVKDVSFRVCPIDFEEANKMIKDVKAYNILSGVRGEKSVNIKALAEIIVKVSKLSLNEDITEIDLNPVMVNHDRATIVDVRIMK
jgi:acetyl-CoA synthetase (ADP-forming)